MQIKVIGCGAAGNKAAITLIENGYPEASTALVNTTKKDIPEKYQSLATIFGTGFGGCGKERKLGKSTLLESLKQDSTMYDELLDEEDDAVVLVGSTEGGSGSASIPLLAKYYSEVHDMNVICVLFFGFGEDTRGLQNSIELCQELSETYTVIGISNEKFMAAANKNKFKAERLANEKFVSIIRILTGSTIIPGDQVIDDTDLYKTVVTPGYMIVDQIDLEEIPKSRREFDESVADRIIYHKFIDVDENPGAKRQALIFNVPDSTSSAIDFNLSSLEEMYGTPYEKYTNCSTDEAYSYSVGYIVSGMKLPIGRIQKIYESYIENSKKVRKDKDSFFGAVSSMKGNAEDSQFDMMATKPKASKKAKESFFGSIDNNPPSDVY